MTPKYTPCKNCGAVKYEIKSLNTLECEYCGTEYVIEVPDGETIYNERGDVVSFIPDKASYFRRDSDMVFLYDSSYKPLGLISVGDFRDKYPEQQYKLYL